MNRVLQALVILQLPLAVAAAIMGNMLFHQRAMLKGRAQTLERAIVALATTFENSSAPIPPPDHPTYPERDVDRVDDRDLPEPQRAAFWSAYRLDLESEGLPGLDLRERAAQLSVFYRIDPATGKPLRDELTGAPIASGPGTMHEWLDLAAERALGQIGRLHATRDQLRRTREELVDTIRHHNEQKQRRRLALQTVEEQRQSIARLEERIRERDVQVAEAAAKRDAMRDALAEAERAATFRQERIVELEDDVARLAARLRGTPTNVGEHLRRGSLGTIASVDDDWKFVVVSLDASFVGQYEQLRARHPLGVPLELTIRRDQSGVSRFITKGQLTSVDAARAIGIVDVIAGWSQDHILPGDQVVF